MEIGPVASLRDFHFWSVSYFQDVRWSRRHFRRYEIPYSTSNSQGKSKSVARREEMTVPEEHKLRDSPEWQLACHVASSKTFARSELLPKFLLYVCAQQLAGNAHQITEQRIGIEVFQRPQGYNPGEDNIVRNYARLLRKRLADYFEREGAKHSLRIEIPRGGYVPRFWPGAQGAGDKADSLDTSLMPHEADIVDQSAPASSPRNIRIASLLLVAILGLLAGILLRPVWLKNTERPVSPAHILWIQLFQQNRNLMIVPPDSGLGILENITGHQVSLEDYASGRYLNTDIPVPGLATDNHKDLRRQRYTSMAGLKITSSLLQIPEFIPNRSEIRDARDMSPEDFKSSNVILIGSVHANPWVGLFEKGLNFKLTYTDRVDQSYIVNENPIGAEEKIYRNGEDGKENRTYGVIDYLPNLHNSGHVLIIQGLNMAATQAAAELLSNRDAIQPALDKAKRADGSLDRFELLLETNSIVATAPSARILSIRVYPS
jgi:hypothetical protein